ncbi:MAG: SRPBCC family protein [Gemmataceae bacterium]
MRTVGSLTVTTPGDRAIALTRTFDAPRRLVFEALTTPERVKRWLAGPPGWTMTVCAIDLRPGGAYRYEWSGPDGARMGMGGVYREVTAPERVVQTERFDEAWYPGEAVGTAVLVEDGGKTTLTTTVVYESQEVRDAVLRSPMEQGVAAGYDRLAELLAS